jgi:hemolysin activation/secretion protein
VFGFRPLVIWAAVFLAYAFIALQAHAQGLPAGGNTVPQGSPLSHILPQPPPPVGGALPALPGPAVPGPVPQADVAVSGTSIEGATEYPESQLAPLVAGLNGPAVPLARIEQARLAVLNLYRADGFVLTTVNAALDPGGRLRFVVIEGYIAKIQLEGDIGPAATQALRFLNHLVGARPVSTAMLERWLLLVQDIPGVAVHAVLRPSANDPGAITLVAQLSRQAFAGLLTVDNRAFRLTGPVELLAVLDANSFTQFGERTELSLFHSDGGTQNFGQASEEFFVGGSGLKFHVSLGNGQTEPSDALRKLGYHGFTTVASAAATYPVIRSRQQTLTVGAYFDVEENEIKLDIGPLGQSIRSGRDSLRVGRVAADYALQDIWLGGAFPAVDSAELRISHGFTGLGGTDTDNPLPSRAGENPGFTKIDGEIARTQSLFSPWNGATVALKAALAGQYSGDVLPPTEQYFLGGAEFDRGFYAGEVTGDSALTGTLELQLNTGIDLPWLARLQPVSAQFYLFRDQGETWNNTPLDPNQRLSSEGGGVRLGITRFTEFDLEGVIRDTRTPAGTAGEVTALKADALYWRVLARF